MTAAPTMDEAYRKATAAGLAFLVCMEVMYFALSPAPSFRIPSMDAVGETAIGRDFLNIWIGAKSAFAGGPAVFFDFWNYNLYLQDYFGSADLHHYFWSYPPHIAVVHLAVRPDAVSGGLCRVVGHRLCRSSWLPRRPAASSASIFCSSRSRRRSRSICSSARTAFSSPRC